MAETLAATNPGWIGQSNDVRITVDSHNTLGMSTRSRLATGSGESLSGTYQVNIGSELYYNKRNYEIRHGTYIYDKWWPSYKFELYAATTLRDFRISSVGVENHYVKQKININIDVFTELEELIIETEDNIEPELPVEFENVTFDDEWYGDMDVALGGDVELPFGFSMGEWGLIIGIGIGVIVLILIGFAVWFFYFHPVGRTLRRRWKKSRQARQRERED